jgi:S1-C subfamily serine protease
MSRSAILIGLLLVCAFGAAEPAQAGKIYKWTDANGQTHYSQVPPPDDGKRQLEVRGDDRVHDDATRSACFRLSEFGMRIHDYLRSSGLPDSSRLRRFGEEAMREPNGVTEDQLVEVAEFVQSMRTTARSPVHAGQAVQEACLRGRFGNRATAANADEAEQMRAARSGTGWFVAENRLITSLHVVEGSDRVSVVTDDGKRIPARVAEVDARRDLAVLRLLGFSDAPGLPIAAEEARLGAAVFTIGFPHTGIMGVKPKLTTGVISARTGLRDDPDSYQTSVPVQSGNSGGPLLDERGHVVGIITSKLSADAMYRATEDLTQNVNYAIKAGFARALAGAAPAPTPDGARSLEDVAEQVQRSVVLVIAE